MLNIYKASAGSGKTFTLAREYIKMLLGIRHDDGTYTLNPNPVNSHRNILAITFTNKATDEMKRRIIHELAVLAEAEPNWQKKSNYADLAAEFGCSPEALKESAKRALRRLLFDFNYFNVSTIDAFFQTILRTFAQEAELTGNYELELQNKTVVEEGVSRVISSLSETPDAPQTKHTVNLITAEMNSRLKEAKSSKLLDRSNAVYRSLVEALSQMHDEKFAENNKLSEYLSDRSKLKDFRERLDAHLDSLKSVALPAAKTCEALINSLPGKSLHANFIKAIATVCGNLDYQSKYLTMECYDDLSKVCNKSFTPDPAAEEIIRNAIKSVADYQTHSKLYAAISANLLALSLMADVMEKMEEYRTENNAMLLSDTNSLLHDIIGDDDAPFVYERMGQWFNNYLIDEFQDTSKLQWRCLQPLVREGLSEGDNSLIIGDEKQCIYRFRNSEPELLGHTVEDELKAFASTRSSDTNYRSSVDVVEFNNTIFAQMAADMGQSSVYANVCQQPHLTQRRGYVKINRMSDTGEKEVYEQESLNLLAADIKRQLDAGYRPADIAVLTRFNDDGRAVINHLLNLQVTDPTYPKFGIVSDDALSLASAPVVHIIVGALRAHALGLLKTDTVPSTRSRAGLEQMIGRYESGIGFGLSPDEALKAAVITPEAGAAAERDTTYTHSAWSLLSLVEGVIATAVPQDLFEPQHAFIAAFMDVVQEFSTRNPSADINSFLAWWNDNARRCLVSAPADTQAIRVMSIHKSKGLEFPCVHLPLLWEDIIKFKSPEWFDTEGFTVPETPEGIIPPMVLIRPAAVLEGTPYERQYQKRINDSKLDELNVLYVAFTRAVDELCVHTYRRVTKGRSSVMTHSTVVLDALCGAYGVDLEPGGEFTIGSPTKPSLKEASQPTALDPTETDKMAPFFSYHRPELWEGIVLAKDNDEL